MECLSQHITFLEFCEKLNSIMQSETKDKLKILAEYFKFLRIQGPILELEYPRIHISLYPIIRLLIPQEDRKMGPFGLREKQLTDTLSQLLGLPPHDQEYLANYWKKGEQSSYDLAQAVFIIAKKYIRPGIGVSLFDVNNFLRRMSANKRDQQKALFEEFLLTIGPEELKWLVRIILKNMRLGLSAKQVLEVFHKDACSLLEHNTNLEETCTVLHDPKFEIIKNTINLFEPFRPMLSQRCSAKDFRKINQLNKKYYIETKFDGERFQLHMKNNEFRYYSRNGFDFTETFGKNFNSGILTPKLEHVFNIKVKSIILDGEMMGWNPETKEFGSKGMKFDVKHLNENTKYKPVFCVFDMVYLNGEVYSKSPLFDRQAIMLSYLTPKEGALKISQVFQVSTGQEILNRLNESVDKDDEGIVFKDPMSMYVPNSRNGNWYKMKLEYFKGTMHDLDVVVIGGYFGKRFRNGRIVSFLVAIIEKEDSVDAPKCYKSFCKLKTGLKDEDLVRIEIKTKGLWQNVDENKHKTGVEDLKIEWGKERPDVYINPERSIVFEVRGSELISVVNNEYASPYTLRFPRIQAFRQDKSYYDCLTMEELLGLITGGKSVQKLSKRHLKLSDLDEPPQEKRFKTGGYVPPEIPQIEKKKNILDGFEFHVLTGMPDWRKEDVEKDIIENGGSIVQYERPTTHCILYGDYHPKLNWYKGDKDFVHLGWLKQVIENGQYVAYVTVYRKGKNDRYDAPVNADEFGDRYNVESTERDVEEFLKRSSQEVLKQKMLERDVDEFYNFMPSEKNPLQYTNAYFDRYPNPGEPKLDSLWDFNENCLFDFVRLGGTIATVLDSNVDIIVMQNQNDERAAIFYDIITALESNIVIMTEAELMKYIEDIDPKLHC